MKNLKKYEITLDKKSNINWLIFSKDVEDLVVCKYTNAVSFKCSDILKLIKKLNSID